MEQRTLKTSSSMNTPSNTSSSTPPAASTTSKTGFFKPYKWWWLIVLIVFAVGTGALVNWIRQKHSTTVSQTPSDDYQRQQRNATNEVAELRQRVAELRARLAAVTTNSSSATINTPTTNATPTVTSLGVVATNVSSTVVSSNIYGPINTAGGNVNYTAISYGSPSNMVTMRLMAWPSWVKSNPTNSFTAPGPRIEIGKVTTMMIYKGCALEINLEDGFTLHPDVNDLRKVSMLWGDQRGCLTFDPDRQFNLPSGHVGTIRNLVWLTPDSPDEAVEFRFMVVPK